MAMVPVAYRPTYSGWLGLKVGGCLAQPCIHQMNRVYGALESVVCLCYGAIEIVIIIIIIFIIIIFLYHRIATIAKL